MPFAMQPGRFRMRSEDAPPGFWAAPDLTAPVDGVRIESALPTRFFQSLDHYPPAWGTLRWRIQLNALRDDVPDRPAFRGFYPGVEWNLRGGTGVWLLTAWFAWDGPGPEADRLPPAPPRLEGDVALFPFAGGDAPLFLRSRVDARDRRAIAAAVRSQAAAPAPPDAPILLDDLLDGHHP